MARIDLYAKYLNGKNGMTTAREVFDSIAHCENVGLCRRGDESHPCSAIVRSQVVSDKEFQLPEPWRGRIEKARLLFIGSNPSIGNDRFALQSSSESQLWESQHLAFGGGSRPYIVDGIRTTKADGSPDRIVRYWSSIRARARELIPSAIPGEDYAITEVVHCKSRGEEGVAQAAQTCYDLHMASVLSIAVANVIIVLGAFGKRHLLGAAPPPPSPLQLELGGQKRTVLVLPHPNARGVRKALAAHYSFSDLVAARKLLAGF